MPRAGQVSQVNSARQITDTAWHHLAVTRAGSSVIFYVDGVSEPALTLDTVFQFHTLAAIGARGDSFANGFQGLLDEISIYGHALAASEIQAIYNAGSAGKCSTPTVPSITTQPADSTVTAGFNTTFSVLAGGSRPLSYQWQFNGTNLANATGSALTLVNIQTASTGDYSVTVTNANGSITSRNAVLTVNVSCVPAPSALVGWWRGEGDPSDVAGGNNGTLHGSVTYAPGGVGQTFSFNGSGAAVSIGNPVSLQLQDFTIEAWIQRGSTAQASQDYNGGSIFGYGSGGFLLGLGDAGNIYLTDVGQSQVSASKQITDKGWHHLAVTKVGGTVVF